MGPGPVVTDLSCLTVRQCARNRVLPHQVKASPAVPTSSTPAVMVRGSGPPVPGPPAGATAAAWVGLAGLVTGLVQFDSVEAVAEDVVPGSVIAASGVADPSGDASAGSGAAGTMDSAGGGAGVEVAVGWAAAGGAGSGPPGWPGGSSGPFGLSARPSPGFVSVGSGVQDAPHEGLVMVVAVGSGVSAAAAPAADRLTASARTAADAVAGTARSAGKDGDICYLSMRAVPRCGFLVSPVVFYTSTEGRKSTGSAALRGRDA